MTKAEYEKWDSKRRYEYPNAAHERWESWNGGKRIAAFDDCSWWVSTVQPGHEGSDE